MLLRLAWRNLWRSPRRTGLTAAAGVFAVVLMLWSLALAAGSHERWIDQVVRLYPGHVEVTGAGYRENRTLDYGITLASDERGALDEMGDAVGWAPRLETWALAIPDRDDATGRAAWVVGLAPEREAGLSRLADSVASGRFLATETPDELEIVLGATLAENLGVALGDQVILLAGDYYGSQSADRFRVVGLLSVGDSRFDGYASLVRIDQLQGFLVFPDGVSHVALFADESAATGAIERAVAEIFPPGPYEILAWPELIPDVVQFMILDDLGNYLMLSVLVVIVAFGLLNTILMSVFERVREFGVMRALGVRPRRVFALVVVESFLISVIGIAVGFAIGLPVMAWLAEHPLPLPGGEAAAQTMALFNLEPVILFKTTFGHVVGVTGVLLVTSFLAALPPAIRAARGRPVDALRET